MPGVVPLKEAWPPVPFNLLAPHKVSSLRLMCLSSALPPLLHRCRIRGLKDSGPKLLKRCAEKEYFLKLLCSGVWSGLVDFFCCRISSDPTSSEGLKVTPPRLVQVSHRSLF